LIIQSQQNSAIRANNSPLLGDEGAAAESLIKNPFPTGIAEFYQPRPVEGHLHFLGVVHAYKLAERLWFVNRIKGKLFFFHQLANLRTSVVLVLTTLPVMLSTLSTMMRPLGEGKA
jgi:hypothetical protein